MAEEWFKTAFLAHYPLLYVHRDLAEARRCLDLLGRLAPWGGNILDLGCGDGRHLRLLDEAGHRAVGLDLSQELLEGAREAQSPENVPTLVRGDMRALPFLDESYSAVFSLFTAFGYFGSPRDNAGPVREIARVLEMGGHWFLDYFDGDKVREELVPGTVSVREREMGPLFVREERSFDKDSSQVKKAVSLMPRAGCEGKAQGLGVPREGLEYTEQVAVFTLAQLDELVGDQGLRRVASVGGYEGQPLGEGSRWILVFQKVPDTAKL